MWRMKSETQSAQCRYFSGDSRISRVSSLRSVAICGYSFTIITVHSEECARHSCMTSFHWFTL